MSEGIDCNLINPYVIRCNRATPENTPPPGTRYERRIVKWYEVEYISHGNGEIETNGIMIPATGGTVFFRTPGMIVQGITPYYGYLIVFDIAYDADKSPLYAEINPFNTIRHDISGYNLGLPPFISIQNTEKIEALFHSAYHAYFTVGITSQMLLKTSILQILMMLIQYTKESRPIEQVNRSIRFNNDKVNFIKNYIGENIQRQFTLSELSELCGLSKSFLSRIFKKIVGINLFEYIGNSRINLSIKLLIDTNNSVKEICYQCGFENESYFYILFKKKEGISPIHYRERHRFTIE